MKAIRSTETIGADLGGLLIGEVARQAGVQPSTLRYYESIGLLPAPGRRSGQRRYKPDVLQRLAIIDFAKQCGFTIAEIQTLFEGFEFSSLPTPASIYWKELARQKLSELDAMISRARAMQALLEQG